MQGRAAGRMQAMGLLSRDAGTALIRWAVTLLAGALVGVGVLLWGQIQLLHYVRNGVLTHRTRGEPFAVGPGDACLLNLRRAAQYGNEGSDPVDLYWVLFDGPNAEALAASLHALTGNVVDTQQSCDGCVTQLYTRISNTMNMCLGSSTGNFSVNASTMFNAPSTPGIYFINGEASWQYVCETSTSSSGDITDATVGYLITYR